jgi:hypothetical protein
MMPQKPDHRPQPMKARTPQTVSWRKTLTRGTSIIPLIIPSGAGGASPASDA